MKIKKIHVTLTLAFILTIALGFSYYKSMQQTGDFIDCHDDVYGNISYCSYM